MPVSVVSECVEYCVIGGELVTDSLKDYTRSERAYNVKKAAYLYDEYEGVAREVLETLLDKYATSNLVDLDDTRVLSLEEFHQFGSLVAIVRAFGGKAQFLEAA